MNSASRGLRPTVGLRRPKKHAPRRRRPTPGASAPSKADFNRHRAFGHQSACTPNEFGLQGPPADGRPAPTEKARSASAKADARRTAPWKADFNRHRAFGRRPARRMNSASGGLRPTVGLRRPKKSAPRRRRPTPGAQRLGRPISIGTKAFGRRPARRMNSASRGLRPTVGLRRPKARSASAKADARRTAPWKADFNRHESLRPRSACTPNEFGLRWPPADGRPAPTRKHPPRVGEGRRPAHSALEGRFQSAQSPARRKSLRPTVGLRRPERLSSAFARSGLPSRTVDASGKTRGGPPEGPATPSTGGCRGSGHSSSSSSSSTFFPRPMTSTSGASAGSGASSMASAAGAVTSAISSSGSLTMVTPGGA
jgi:hypothetical protein